MKRLLYYILFFIISFVGKAQDPQMTQYFAAPQYLAPSFAGNTEGSRATLNFRDQWPAIPGSFITYMIGLDHNLYHYNSGIGLLIMHDQAGSGALSTTNISFQYAYSIKINRQFALRPGISFIYAQRAIDINRLVFGDQLHLDKNNATSIESHYYPKVTYFDNNISIVGFTKLYWGGFFIGHLLPPNQALKMDGYSELTTLYKVMGGAKIMLNGKPDSPMEESIKATFLYKAQGEYDQFDIGAYWYKVPFSLGIWYRGIPFFKHYARGYANQDAIAFVIGYQMEQMKIGYSYDFTISRLAFNTAGSHEVSLSYEFNQTHKSRSRKHVIIPCAKF